VGENQQDEKETARWKEIEANKGNQNRDEEKEGIKSEV
jgi:hypothetical protein